MVKKGPAIVIDIGVKLRPYQLEVDRHLKRFNALVWHRRAGKSYWSAWRIVKEMVKIMQEGKLRNPQFAYIAPSKEQARNIIWDYLKQFTNSFPDVHYNEQKLIITVTLPGRTPAKIYLLGVENFESIRGMYFDGVVCDEYSEWDPRAWRTVIRATLADRKGWAIFIGTSKGPNHFAELYQERESDENWYCKKVTVVDSKAIDDDELADMKKNMTPEEYEMEMMCSFKGSTKGFYYAHIVEAMRNNNQILPLPAVPSAPVFTFWDLGISDYMVVWFVQKAAGQLRVIDYIEETGKGIPQICKMLKEKPYIYEKHILPHDGGHRSVDTGITRKDTLESIMGLGTVEVLERLPVADGIDKVREVLPQTFICSVKCEKGLKALSCYQKEYDHKLGIYKDHPLHDWSSHGADGFRTLAMGLKFIEYISNRKLQKRPVQANMEYDVFA